jgi:hypothetical protein
MATQSLKNVDSMVHLKKICLVGRNFSFEKRNCNSRAWSIFGSGMENFESKGRISLQTRSYPFLLQEKNQTLNQTF